MNNHIADNIYTHKHVTRTNNGQCHVLHINKSPSRQQQLSAVSTVQTIHCIIMLNPIIDVMF